MSFRLKWKKAKNKKKKEKVDTPELKNKHTKVVLKPCRVPRYTLAAPYSVVLCVLHSCTVSLRICHTKSGRLGNWSCSVLR